MADDRERSRSPERGDEGAAPAPAPAADDYPAPAPAADNDTGGDANGAAAANGATGVSPVAFAPLWALARQGSK